MPYELPSLPYAHDALEPTIDAQTMQIHHGKHHQAYVDNLNKALEGTEWDGKPIEQVLGVLDALPEDKQGPVRNNGGGHANHSLFWQIMKPGGGGDPSGPLADAIADTFGDVGQLRSALNDGGVKRFGSGWTWLVWDGTGLSVYSTPNQDSPCCRTTCRSSASTSGSTPITCTTRTGARIISAPGGTSSTGTRSHAATTKRATVRRAPACVGAWWDVVNWDEVARRYDEARGAGARARRALLSAR